MAKLTNGYNVVIQQKVGATNRPIYPFTHSANVIDANGDNMDTVISGILAKNFVPDYSSETTSSLRFLRNDNTWATIQSASTTQAGVVQLTSALDSTSETTAATAAAAKALKDAIDVLNGTVDTTGSVLKMIKDNAKDAIYKAATETEEAITIEKAIQNAEKAAKEAGVVDVVKQETAEEGYSATYYITQAGTQVGTKINIPKDYLVKSAELKTCTEKDKPVAGYNVGDKYIDFVVNTTEGAGNESHIYLLVTDLIDVYTGKTVTDGISVAVSADNEISATVSGKAIARANVTDEFEADIAALEATHGKNAAGEFETVSEQISAEGAGAIYKAATETAVAVTIKAALDDLYNKAEEGVDGKIKTAIEALDATVSQDAGADGLAVSIVEEDGKLKSVTASIKEETYDEFGAAAAVQGSTTETVASVDAKAVANKDAIDILNSAATVTGSVAKSVKDAVEALDATVSQDAGADGLAVSIVEEDGKLKSVTASIAEKTYDAFGAAAAVQGDTTSTVASNKAAIDTLNGNSTVAGSVARSIMENAKYGTYSVSETGVITTIEEAIANAEEAAKQAGVVSVVKQETAEEGYIATYYVTQADKQVGAKINIPKDYLVKSCTVKTCETADDPVAGYKVGDKYIDFVVNTVEGSGSESHIYLLVNELVDVYTGKAVTNGITITIDEHNEVAATVSGKAIARANVTDEFEADLAALEGTHKTTESGALKSVSAQITDEAADATYKAATESEAAVSIKGAIDDLYTKSTTDVDTKIKTAIEDLNATVSQEASAVDANIAATVVEEDGKLKSVTVSQDAATASQNGYMTKEYAAKLDGCLETAVSTDTPTFASGSGIWMQIVSED